MLSAEEYALLSTTAWRDPANVGEFFVVPYMAITNIKQKTHKRIWQASKDLKKNSTTSKWH